MGVSASLSQQLLLWKTGPMMKRLREKLLCLFFSCYIYVSKWVICGELKEENAVGSTKSWLREKIKYGMYHKWIKDSCLLFCQKLNSRGSGFKTKKCMSPEISMPCWNEHIESCVEWDAAHKIIMCSEIYAPREDYFYNKFSNVAYSY